MSEQSAIRYEGARWALRDARQLLQAASEAKARQKPALYYLACEALMCAHSLRDSAREWRDQ